MALPVVIVAAGGLPTVRLSVHGGLPVTLAAQGLAVTEAASGYGLPVTFVTEGGSVVLPPASAWTPAQLTTLKGWYKADTLAGADNSAIASWPDASGLGNNATQVNSPTLQTAEQNSLNVVQLNGTNQHFTLPNLLSGAVGATGVAAAIVTKVTGTPGDTQGGPLKIGTENGLNGNNHYPYSDGNAYDDFACTFRKTISGGASGVTSWHIGSFHSKNSDWRYFKNGTQIHNSITDTLAVMSTPFIGRGFKSSGALPNYYGGMIGEIVIVNEFLSDSDRQKLEGYLAHKWGLAAALPAGHPYKASPP